MFGTPFGTAFGAPPPENHDQPKETHMAASRIYRSTADASISRTPNYQVDIGQLTQSGASEPVVALVNEALTNAEAATALRAIADAIERGE